MQNRLTRKLPRARFSHPFESATKSLSTLQGRYTFYAITTCAIFSVVLHRALFFLARRLNPALPPQAAADLATLIAGGVCAVLLVTSLLKMDAIIGAVQNQRLKAFNKRLAKRKESENSNG